MTRIYYNREKIHKFDNKASDVCIKYKMRLETLLHAFTVRKLKNYGLILSNS